MGVVAGVTSFVAGVSDAINRQKTASKLARFNERRFRTTEAAINESLQRQGEAANRRTNEQRSQIAAEVENITRKGLETRGLVFAGQGAATVAGQSVVDVVNDITKQEATTRSRLDLFQEFREDATEAFVANAVITARLRTLGALPGPVVQPDFTTDVLKAAAAALGTGAATAGAVEQGTTFGGPSGGGGGGGSPAPTGAGASAGGGLPT